MTNEQAIKWLKAYIQDTPFQMEQYERAFEMAISALNSLEEVYAKGYNDGFTQAEVNFENDKALSQEPCDKCEVGNPCLYCKHEFEPQESEE